MNFLDNETVELAKNVGFDEPMYSFQNHEIGGSYYSHGYTLQQVEEWLWNTHGCNVLAVRTSGLKFCFNMYHKDFYLRDGVYADPFTARLEGVKQALNYLKEKK